ncbi:MAG: hypothetical protein WC044_06055 [Crocinitomicaceae bacterium]
MTSEEPFSFLSGRIFFPPTTDVSGGQIASLLFPGEKEKKRKF